MNTEQEVQLVGLLIVVLPLLVVALVWCRSTLSWISGSERHVDALMGKQDEMLRKESSDG